MKQMLAVLAVLAIAALVGTYLLFQRHSRGIAPPEDLVAAIDQAPSTDLPPADSAPATAPPPAAVHAAPAGARPMMTEGGPTGTADAFVPPPNVRAFSHSKTAMPSALQTQAGQCQAGLLLDVTNQQVLWTKNPDTVLPIASITKLMTLYVALDAIAENPKWDLDLPSTVSARAMNQGGSQLWLEKGATYPIQNLMQAMMIQSANDAAYVVAETVADGDMDAFVAAMNRRARFMGLRGARFFNPNGMPGKDAESDNRASAYDLAMLSLACKRFPVLWTWSGTATARFIHTNGTPIDMANTNRLVRGGYPGVTGLKTGFINRSGFCMVATATRDNRELMVVALGFERRQNRDDFVTSLLEWGYQQRVR